jgi:hypothetical protein
MGITQNPCFCISVCTVSNMNSDLKASILLRLLALCNELKFYVLHFNTDRTGEHLSTRRLPTRVKSKQVVTLICPRHAAFRRIIRKPESRTHFTVCEYHPKQWPFYPFLRSNNQQDATLEFIIPPFIEGSTCFERPTAHHQEL